MLDIVKDRIRTLKTEWDATGLMIGDYENSEEYKNKNAVDKNAALDFLHGLEMESIDASIRLKLYNEEEEIKDAWDSPVKLLEFIIKKRKEYMDALHTSIKTDETRNPKYRYNRIYKFLYLELCTLEAIIHSTYKFVPVKDSGKSEEDKQ